MFQLSLDDSAKLSVNTRKHQYHYATDASLPNPLEATYACLTACAGVYVKKAAQKINKSCLGISIQCRSVVKPEKPHWPAKWITQITFPETWSHDDQQLAMEYVQQCAVKELITKGYDIEFETLALTDNKKGLNLDL